MTIALVDCNSFYCSCERVFNPKTRGRPVIVLSNNDGCAIAFSKEAKAIGFGQMCEPYFEVQERIRKHNVAVFSSNYTLYDDMSKRVMSILKDFTPDLEVYSIDEAFLSLKGFERYDLIDYGKSIRRKILQTTGIPVGVGIANTKVLSKIANKISKENNGVSVLLEDSRTDSILKNFPVEKIWGIGGAGTKKLNSIGIRNAYDFKMYNNEARIQKLLTKTGRQVQDELRGISCLDMQDVEDKKCIANTRSFGRDTYDRSELKEAIATFCTKAFEKLRQQESVCFNLSVFIHTNSFKELPQYYGSGTHTFLSGTSDTIKAIKAAHEVLDRIYRRGFAYKKGGVILSQIVPESQNQLSLIETNLDDNQALNSVMDKINAKLGLKRFEVPPVELTSNGNLEQTSYRKDSRLDGMKSYQLGLSNFFDSD